MKKYMIYGLIFCGLLIILAIELTDAYIPHATIHINGNDDFASQTQQEGWRGDGTVKNPYIIRGYEINATTTHGIWIENTTVYFRIIDCYIHSNQTKYHGVFFSNVTNGRIEDIICHKNYYGILFEKSLINKIVRCNISDNYGIGIFFKLFFWEHHRKL